MSGWASVQVDLLVVQQVGGMVWDGCVGVWLDGGAGDDVGGWVNR